MVEDKDSIVSSNQQREIMMKCAGRDTKEGHKGQHIKSPMDGDKTKVLEMQRFGFYKISLM